MRIIITGSRNYSDYEQLKTAILDTVNKHSANNEHTVDTVCIVHGGARGADSLAGKVAKDCGFEEEVFAARWDVFGKKAGPIRNEKMVDSGADICLAFPLGDSFGTRNCIKLAKKAGIKTIVF